jgi:hypothetical protein
MSMATEANVLERGLVYGSAGKQSYRVCREVTGA